VVSKTAYKEDTQDEINIIYQIISKDINNKKFLKIYKKDSPEKDEKDLSGLVNYSNLLDLDQCAPMINLINKN